MPMVIVAEESSSMWAAQNGKQERSQEAGALERECPSIKPQPFFDRTSGVASWASGLRLAPSLSFSFPDVQSLHRLLST